MMVTTIPAAAMALFDHFLLRKSSLVVPAKNF